MTWPTGESLFACLHFAVPGGHTLITLNEWRKAGTQDFLFIFIEEHERKMEHIMEALEICDVLNVILIIHLL